MTGALIVCRGLLAVAFAVAGAGKLLDRAGTREALRAFGLPSRFERAWPALPALELLVACGLLIPGVAVAAAVGALVLLAVFCAAVGRAMARGESPDCHCFGQLHSEPAGIATLVRNVVLAVPAVLTLTSGPGPSFPHALGALTGTEAVLAAVSVLAAGLFIACAQLVGERRELREQLAQARAAKPPPGLPRGVPAPELVLTALRGPSGALGELRGIGERAVIVFVSAGCKPCRALLPALARWQDTLADLRIVPIFAGASANVDALVQEADLALALRQEAGEASAAYNLRETPAAILIGPDGRIASAPAIGAPSIEALIRSVLAAGAPPGPVGVAAAD